MNLTLADVVTPEGGILLALALYDIRLAVLAYITWNLLTWIWKLVRP
jgi:hypothetical protein